MALCCLKTFFYIFFYESSKPTLVTDWTQWYWRTCSPMKSTALRFAVDPRRTSGNGESGVCRWVSKPKWTVSTHPCHWRYFCEQYFILNINIVVLRWNAIQRYTPTEIICKSYKTSKRNAKTITVTFNSEMRLDIPLTFDLVMTHWYVWLHGVAVSTHTAFIRQWGKHWNTELNTF